MSDIGAEKILQAIIRNRAGVLSDPLTVTGSIRKPDNSVTPLNFVKVSTGVYEAVYTPTASGDYWWRVQTTGVINTAEEKTFTVEERMVP